MSGRFLIDLTDARFQTAENADVIAFIRRANPFAHSDVGSLLFELGDTLDGAHAYCPLPSSYAYVVLHTAAHRIVAIAFGMRGLAFRLAPSTRAEALAAGGAPAPEIGPDWVRIEPWAAGTRAENEARRRRWAERALTDALAAA